MFGVPIQMAQTLRQQRLVYLNTYFMSVFVKWERKMSEREVTFITTCNNGLTTPNIHFSILAFKGNTHIPYLRVVRLHCLGCYPFALIRSQSKKTNYVAHISNKYGNEESISNYRHQGLLRLSTRVS